MWSIVLLAACSGSPLTPTDPPDGAPADREPSPWDEAVAALDAEIVYAEARALDRPDDWVRAEEVAGMWKSRARLSGSYDDYARVEAWLQAAFAEAPSGSGPWMSSARLHFSLHRLDRVDADVAMAEKRLLLDDVDRAAITLLRADTAYQRGDYEGARDGIAATRALYDHLGAELSDAQLLWHTGDPEAALAAFDHAEALYHGASPEPPAWLHLQRGLLELDRGRWDEAMAHYALADAALDGWWLVEEHQAEILTLTGRTDEAVAMYEDIVDRTGNPEFMDALAAIARERGDEAQAEAWITRAAAVYEAQLARFPEAAAGHALQHYLEFGADPALTLALAEQNAAIRPNGEALTLLASAQLAAGDAEAARATIEAVLATPWWSAGTHVVAAEIYAALGEAALAEGQRQAALAIDPHALD